MSVPRSGHAATLLANGQVLVSGGDNAVAVTGTTYDTCELFDPASGRWLAAPSLREPRTGHAALRLPGSRVLVVMGFAGDLGLLTTEVLDVRAGTWSRGPRLGERRDDDDSGPGCAVVLRGGSVLVAGGYDGVAARFLASAELLPAGGTAWVPVGAMSAPRVAPGAVRLPGASVLVAGGDNSVTTESSADVYEPATRTWAPAAPMAEARWVHSATLLRGGRVLVAGGQNAAGELSTAEVFTS